MRSYALLLLLIVGTASAEALAQPGGQRDSLSAWLTALEQRTPDRAQACTASAASKVREAARRVERAASAAARYDNATTPAAVLRQAEQVLDAKTRVDELLDAALELRTQFVGLEPGEARRDQLRAYLRTTTELIDLSGRLRYLLNDALGGAAYRVARSPEWREALIDQLIAAKSGIGANVMSVLLFDPPASAGRDIRPASDAIKAKVLRLIAVSRNLDMIRLLARYVREGRPSAPLAVLTTEAIRAIGLPQDPRPNTPDDLPDAPITAAALHKFLAAVDPSGLRGTLPARRAELLQWLDARQTRGLTERGYRLGPIEVEPGDWLLMRNPSPYNLFTDLSPGLFTHVGVVAFEDGSDGKRRMVLVDLPERGTAIPATNVEIFVQRTLHYVFLRHPNPAVADTMSAAARSVVGNDVIFDLNFQTDRVLKLKGKPLAGERIHTYCAGFLLLCALQTPRAREEFFPIPEFAAGGNTVENLKRFGMSIGNNFISPTGALLSPNLQLVGRRSPMYDPRREVEEAVFDHFAEGLAGKDITPPRDLYQALRLRLAEAAKHTPWLARALADAANVNRDMDLVAAAQAAAVVETLDEIAYGASGDFLNARRAVMARSLETRPGGLTADEVSELQQLRRRHARLQSQWQNRQVSPRRLRVELVDYYIRQGRSEIDRRFFGENRPAGSR